MRYQNKTTLVVGDPLYKKKLIEQGVGSIEIEQPPDLAYPTVEQIRQLEVVHRTWGVGDRLYKYAHEYYGDSRLWWVIAFYNKKPTESHFGIGDIVRIPMPLQKVLDFMGY